jgi:hypothetical protein
MIVLQDLGYFSASTHLVAFSTQLVSQVLPPSAKNACSKRHELAVMSAQAFCTKTLRPLNGSVSKNSPRPFLNSPKTDRRRRAVRRSSPSDEPFASASFQ